MIESVILAFLLACFKKYQIGKVFKYWPIYPVLLAVALYVYLDLSALLAGKFLMLDGVEIYQIITLTFVFILLWVTRQGKPGLVATVLLLVGKALNCFVMKANGGKMPVFPSLSNVVGTYTADKVVLISQADPIHALGNAATKFSFLGDWIDLGYTLMSPGDVLARVFLFMVLYGAIKYANREAMNRVPTERRAVDGVGQK
jgi:hypothetical protein